MGDSASQGRHPRESRERLAADGVALLEDVPLAPRTTLGVGGSARYLVRCADVAGLDAVRRFAAETELELFVLGGGSNLLVADEGFDGVVVELDDESLVLEPDDDEHVLVRAGASLDWDGFVERMVAEGLAGVECLSGIPGRVGAAPIQNVGAYGQEVAEALTAVDVLDLETGASRRLSRDECGFGYRWSHFKGPWCGRFVVTGVHFRLRRSDVGSARYPELRRRLDLDPERDPETDPEGDSDTPSLLHVREAVLDLRRSKSMVLDPAGDRDDPNRRSAGSFFVNPVVDAAVADAVVETAQRELGREPVRLSVGDRVKLSAAWLIEAAGFEKGYRRGRAGISTCHSLALVNRGGAMAAEIVGLAREIRGRVRERFGVQLSPEPTFLGFDPHPFPGSESSSLSPSLSPSRSAEDRP